MATRRRSSTPGHVRRRGANTWQILLESVPDPLTSRRRRITRTIHGSRQDAERVRAELVLDLGDGRAQAGGRSRLNDLIDRWLEHATPELAPKTAYNYRRLHERYIRDGLGRRPIEKIGPVDLDDLYARLRADGLSTKTVRNVHALLRRALTQAVRWGWIRHNPATLATPPRSRSPRLSPPSAEDVQRILTAAFESDPALGTFVFLAATTGARRGELDGLRWSDVDFEKRQLFIERSVFAVNGTTSTKSTKTDRARRIALGAATLAVLRRHRDLTLQILGGGFTDDDLTWLFPGTNGRPLHPDTLTQRFRRLVLEIGIPCRLHDLRHFVATQALAAGVPVRTVSGRLGHANASTTHNIYAHFIEASDRDAAATLDLLVAGQCEDQREPGDQGGRG
jgi:integrase